MTESLDSLTINLLRNHGSINIPAIGCSTVNDNLSYIAISDLKKICDLWKINRTGLKTSAEFKNIIQNYIKKDLSEYKKTNGQFNTTNVSYILHEIKLCLEHDIIIDPCVGDGDLIRYAITLCKKDSNLQICSYDIDDTKKKILCDNKEFNVVNQNTLKHHISYNECLLMMNPPYLSNVQNKSNENKEMYAMYKKDDLYKCYIQTMINNPPKEFIIIVPLNFLCSIRVSDQNLRCEFLNKFNIIRINIFNEPVFIDTTYTVCCIHGILNNISNRSLIEIKTYIYPKPVKQINLTFSKDTKYTIGGEIYNLKKSLKFKICRAIGTDEKNVSNIYLKTIDDGLSDICKKISLTFQSHPKNKMFGKVSDRSYAWITIIPNISDDLQKKIVDEFNNRITKWRIKYNSLFLTNFRDNGRKRISFDLAFRIISNILSEEPDEIKQLEDYKEPDELKSFELLNIKEPGEIKQLEDYKEPELLYDIDKLTKSLDNYLKERIEWALTKPNNKLIKKKGYTISQQKDALKLAEKKMGKFYDRTKK